jgi:hypothetical protein
MDTQMIASTAATEEILRRFEGQCRTSTDINEHLPTLRDLASQCTSVVEMGVRGIISTYALLAGLLPNASPSGPRPSLMCVDIDPIDMAEVKNLADAAGIDLEFVMHDSATVDMPKTDMLWIDTFHVYGHLKRELEAHHAKVGMYIAMHDTEVDGINGEALRRSMDMEAIADQFGYTQEDIRHGLRRAIDEFLVAHGDEWVMVAHYPNNNGLTVLKRK